MHGARRRHGAPHGTFRDYMTGFVLSVILTAIPFFLVMAGRSRAPATPRPIVLVCAIAQILVHMVYFLHMTPKAEGGWLLLSTVFTIVLVVITLAGSLWIIFHLNRNMMPMPTDEHDAGHADRSAAGGAVTRRRAASSPARRVLLAAIAGFRRARRLAARAPRLEARPDRPRRRPPRRRAGRGARARPPGRRSRRDGDEYTRVARHRPLPATTARSPVQAVTELGPGYWVLTPLETPGFTVLVNRGFVPPDRRDPATRPDGQAAGEVTVTGLLRLTEPGGGFLRAQRPRRRPLVLARRRRHRRGPRPRAPSRPTSSTPTPRPNPGGLPVGGLTVVRFRNAHLELRADLVRAGRRPRLALRARRRS